jgi:hypothetical protein
MTTFRRPGRAMALVAALAMAFGGGSALQAGTAAHQAAQNANKNALPVPRKTSRRAIQLGLLGLGGSDCPIVPGAQVGNGWIYARTRNFRRKGVGSRWRHTMNAGLR